MNLWRILLILNLLFFLGQNALAKVYLYEVVTAERRFQTASMMQPDAFLTYYGGRDVIYKLKVVEVLAGNDFKGALEKFKLTDRNYRELAPEQAKPDLSPGRFVWWK